jgi:coenzyme PQQ synthesis protein D (PqqD)
MGLIISQDARWLETPEGLVVLNRSTGRCYHLNKSASVVWTGLTAGTSGPEIRAGLTEHCAVPKEDAGKKYAGMIQHFKSLGLMDGNEEIQ